MGKISYENYGWLRPEKVTMPGIQREGSFDHFQRLTARKTVTKGQKVLGLTNKYNDFNNISSRKSNDAITGYSYDELQRLKGNVHIK